MFCWIWIHYRIDWAKLDLSFDDMNRFKLLIQVLEIEQVFWFRIEILSLIRSKIHVWELTLETFWCDFEFNTCFCATNWIEFLNLFNHNIKIKSMCLSRHYVMLCYVMLFLLVLTSIQVNSCESDYWLHEKRKFSRKRKTLFQCERIARHVVEINSFRRRHRAEICL